MAYYPHASLEVQGIGELVSVTDLELNVDNQGKTETTMKNAGSGFSTGPVMYDGSFTVKVSTAPEANFIDFVRMKQIKGMTFKLADGTRIPLSALPNKAAYKSQEVGADTLAVTWSGFSPVTQ